MKNWAKHTRPNPETAVVSPKEKKKKRRKKSLKKSTEVKC